MSIQKSSLIHAKPWVVVISAALFFAYFFAQMNMFNALGPSMIHHFNIDALSLGNLSAMSLYGNVLLIPIAGLILDRISTRHVILTNMLICTLTTLLFSYAETYTIAAIFRFIAGCTGAFCFLSCIVLASRWFTSAQMGQVIGAVVTMAMLGGALAQEPLLILIHQYGWQLAVRLYAFLGFAFLVLMFFMIEDTPEKKIWYPPPRMTLDDLKSSFFAAVANPQNWLCGVYTSLMNLMVLVIGAVWGSGYLQYRFQLTADDALQVTFLIFVGTMIGSPLVGMISDYLKQRKQVMIYGAIISLLLSLLLILFPHLNKAMLALIFFALGVSTSTQVISYPVIVESNLPQHTGVSESLASFLILGTGAIFQNIFGLMMNFHAKGTFLLRIPHEYNGSDYHFAFLLIPITLLISVCISCCLKESYKKH